MITKSDSNKSKQLLLIILFIGNNALAVEPHHTSGEDSKHAQTNPLQVVNTLVDGPAKQA